MSKTTDRQFERLNKLLDDLLAPVESWSAQEVDQFLVDSGVDLDAANRALYERVSEVAGTYRIKNQDIPSPVVALLSQLRPLDLPTSDPEVAKKAARSWIEKVRRPRSSFLSPEVTYAFRNQKNELVAKDRAVLERMEATLLNRKPGDDR